MNRFTPHKLTKRVYSPTIPLQEVVRIITVLGGDYHQKAASTYFYLIGWFPEPGRPGTNGGIFGEYVRDVDSHDVNFIGSLN